MSNRMIHLGSDIQFRASCGTNQGKFNIEKEQNHEVWNVRTQKLWTTSKNLGITWVFSGYYFEYVNKIALNYTNTSFNKFI